MKWGKGKQHKTDRTMSITNTKGQQVYKKLIDAYLIFFLNIFWALK